jgi:hypothetical protein
MRLARAAALAACLLVVAGAARAGDHQLGVASTWAGPGAATHDMFCDCYAGRVGPQGETERLIDLDPAMVAALGLDPADGLYDVEVWPVGGGSALPNTAMRP